MESEKRKRKSQVDALCGLGDSVSAVIVNFNGLMGTKKENKIKYNKYYRN